MEIITTNMNGDEDVMIDAKDGTDSDNSELQSRKDIKRHSTIKNKQAPVTTTATQQAAAQNATVATGKNSAAAPVAEKDDPYTYYVADGIKRRAKARDWNEIGTGRPSSPLNSTTVSSYENTSVYSRSITNNSECRQSQQRRNQYSPPNSPGNSVAEKSRASLDQISRLQQQIQLTNFSLSSQQLRGEHELQTTAPEHQQHVLPAIARFRSALYNDTDLANSRATPSGLPDPNEDYHSNQHQDNNSLFSMNNGNAPSLFPQQQQQHQLQFPQYQPPMPEYANNMQQTSQFQQQPMTTNQFQQQPMTTSQFQQQPMTTNQFQQQPMTSQSQFVPVLAQQYSPNLLSIAQLKLQQQHLQQQQQQNLMLQQQLMAQENLSRMSNNYHQQHLAMDAGMNLSIPTNNNIPLQPFQSLNRSQASGLKQDPRTEGYGGENGPQLNSPFLSDQYGFEDHTQKKQKIGTSKKRQGSIASSINTAKKKEKHAELKQKLLNDLDFQEAIRNRPFMCLGQPKDASRLTEFLCFLRAECIEVFKASSTDVDARHMSKKVLECQVGIRCRFCAEIPFSSRAGRSSSYPSSLDRIYQSVTMMIREHFPMCPLMLPEVRTKYDCYRNSKQRVGKRKNGSKSYWVDSAKELGMFDSKNDEQMAIIQMLKESDLEDAEEEAESNRIRI